MAYKIIPPDRLFRGKSYSDWIEEWFNFFLCVEPDRRNHGPVVFLHATGKDDEKKNENDSTNGNDSGYRTPYANLPNIRVGADRLQIYEDQAVLLPVITSYAEASNPADDWGVMQDYCGAAIDNGDNPPITNWVTIDGNPINVKNWDPFRISYSYLYGGSSRCT